MLMVSYSASQALDLATYLCILSGIGLPMKRGAVQALSRNRWRKLAPVCNIFLHSFLPLLLPSSATSFPWHRKVFMFGSSNT
ncbi:hypothetical protein LX36DRAFT_664565 [Colletotrichum falcatum]|nr:hypothetical protein LX36DRAFT_664565 [Colletotrichum falcatum]